MKKQICSVLICIITVFSVCTAALADITVEIDSETRLLTAEIAIPGAENKMASIEVFNPGKTPDDIASMTPDGVMDVFDYIREGKFDSSGKLTLSYTLDGESGFHGVRVSPDGMEPVMYPDAFLFVSPEFEAEFLTDYNADDASNDERLELIDANGKILGINTDEMSDCTREQKLSLIDFMGKGFKSLDGLKNAYALGITAHYIKNEMPTDAISNCFHKYKDELEKKCSVFSLYELYIKGNDEEGFYKSFDASGLDNLTDYTGILSERIILYSLKCLKNHQEVENILKTSESLLNEDFSPYYALTEKKQANLELLKGNYDSTADMAQKVHELAKKYKTKKKQETGGGSSSSGAFSGPSVNVTVPPVKIESSADEPTGAGFEDISDYPWAQKAINTLYARGILNGVSETRFEPQRQINREEFTKLVVEAFFEVDKTATTDFSDVLSSHWCFPYVATGCQLELINGISSSEFGIGQPISRQDMALILHRAINAANIELHKVSDISFKDESDVSVYAMDAVEQISQWGIINGFEDGSFAPHKSASRAEAAKIIYETLVKGGVLSD